MLYDFIMNHITIVLVLIVICLFLLKTNLSEPFINNSYDDQDADFIMNNSTIIKINTPWKHLLTDNICRWPNELVPIPTLNTDHININDTPANTSGYTNNTWCGGIDNNCSSNYDCCNNLYCRNGTCQI